ACCVSKDGQAIGFVGESGWGKSTLAEFFCANGYVLLNDDILAIQLGEKAQAMAVPGYPLIKLRPDSGARLRGDFEALPTLYPGTSKRMRNVESFPTHPVPLARLFLLEKEYRDRSYVEYLEPRAALVRLLAHTRVTHLFKHAPETSLHLQQCATLIRQVPILALHRVRSVDRLSELFALVEAELERERKAEAA
ncbi:MAG TPA: hypothetical protein VFG50_14300, partial [Rhodothermales bacterium]|nr:hypothetical protein [Rhodothermales bacterium]